MGLLKKIVARAGGRKRGRLVDFEVRDPGKHIPQIVYWASGGEDLRIALPVSLLRSWGAFGFKDGWNSMMLPLQGDMEGFRRFFELFQPKSLSDMYFLTDQHGQTSVPFMELPWLLRLDPKRPPRKVVAGEDDRPAPPYRSFGPSTPAIIDEQFRRTRETLESIRKHGYLPDRYGDITGYFLRLDGEYRFVVKGGKHRVTALAHLGHQTIPVRLRDRWPRLVDGDRVAEWPLVRNGRVSEAFALAVMRRFFEFDGTQQRALIFGTPSESSSGAMA
jgi:hypothetical protein